MTVRMTTRFPRKHEPHANDSLVRCENLDMWAINRAEVLALTARDVDDGGTLLHVYGTKTGAAKRPILVDLAFQPYLLEAAQGKAPGDLLFPWTPSRKRQARDPGKGRKDALLRRVPALPSCWRASRGLEFDAWPARDVETHWRGNRRQHHEGLGAPGHLNHQAALLRARPDGASRRPPRPWPIADQISLTKIRELSLQEKVPGVSDA